MDTSTRPWAAALLLAACTGAGAAPATTPAQWLAAQEQLAGTRADAARGQAFFTRTHGREWSCASCHGQAPTTPGRHASTGKAIEPLAPAFNPARFTDEARIEKWFRRNCNDVLGRACSAGEKADVLAFLMGFKP